MFSDLFSTVFFQILSLATVVMSSPKSITPCASKCFWLQTPGESAPRDAVSWNKL